MLNKRDTSMVEKKIEVSRSPATIDITIDVFTALLLFLRYHFEKNTKQY